MIRSTDARYAFGLVFARFMALNDDLTIPVPSRMIGGAGPFDFSGVTDISAVDITVKLDAAAADDFTIDLSGAVSQAAVTVDELVTALDTAFTAEGILLDASKEAVTNRLKIVTTDTSDTPDYVQIYGEAAELAELGQGLGLKFIKTDTLKSIGDSPLLKESETFTTQDANAYETEVVTDGYRKGTNLTIVDSAEDWELLSLIEGGTYDDSVSGAETYDTPTSEDAKVYFYIEAFYSVYEEGTNKKADLVGYAQLTYRSCVGNIGDTTHELGFADGNYTALCTSYKDENSVKYGDTQRKNLSVTAYAALDVYDV